MLKTKLIDEVYEMPVYTDEGVYFGDIEESVIASNKIYGWRVKSTRNSHLSKVLGGAKGVVVPHQLVKAIGNIMIIAKAALPDYEEDMIEE
tara:strand:+ start:711 stop:983 length:273 start_codon:yes stop_codon:yes gene_type:complete